MFLKVKNNPEVIENGEIVVFFTGLKSVNTYPKYMRVGEVIDAKSFQVKELATGKKWKVYSQDVIKVGDGILVHGVKATLQTTEQI